MTKLSLLLPTYNRCRQICRLVEFLNKENVSSLDSIEVIVSNNGSNDGTYEYLESIDIENLTVFHQDKNVGLVNNMKFLISKSKGEYIWIMGDNDYYEDGIIEEVLNIIDKNSDIGHIFINYGYINSETGVISDVVGSKSSKMWSCGYDMFSSIVHEVDLGAQMFVSSNIFKRELVIEADCLISSKKEEDNMAFPLGYSLFCSCKAGYYLGKPLVFNETNTPSTWSDQNILVYCRDMIAIYDCIAKELNNYEYLAKLLIDHPMTKYPEYKYLLKQKKFKKNNYALKFMIEHCPYKIFLDFFTIPFFLLGGISKRILKREQC